MTAADSRTTPCAPEVVAQDPVALWASAQVTALGVEDFPEYGSLAWRKLPANDPHRAAALITAAEQWRRHTGREAWLDCLLDEDPEEWFRLVTADADAQARRIAPALARRPTHDELSARRVLRTRARAVTASPGWSPVAIPGRPGYRRHYGPGGEQLDLPDAPPQEIAA